MSTSLLEAVISGYRTLFENDNGEITVGVNDFAKRHLIKAHYTHVPSDAEFERIRRACQRQMNEGDFRDGYAPFVKIVTITSEEFPSIKSTIAKLTDDNRHKLKSKVTKRSRTDGVDERSYEQKYFEHGDADPMDTHHIDVILYDREHLLSENAGVTGADWDIISVNAEPYETMTPMSLTTMLRNEAGPEYGGSGHVHSDEEKAASEFFWNHHAQVGVPPTPRGDVE